MSILITAASQAAAYKLERLLQAPDVIFADNKDNSHLKYSGRKFIGIPPGNSASYAHELLKACLDLGIEKIYPLYFDEIEALSEARQLFDEYGIKVIVPGIDYLSKLDSAHSAANGEFIIVENGEVVAGKLISLPDSLETGIFCFESEGDSPAIKLFAIQHD